LKKSLIYIQSAPFTTSYLASPCLPSLLAFPSAGSLLNNNLQSAALWGRRPFPLLVIQLFE